MRGSKMRLNVAQKISLLLNLFNYIVIGVMVLALKRFLIIF